MEIELKNIAPVKPVAAYVGGKRMLANELIARINAIPHATYAEAFVGMGGVFFRRNKTPKSEVINDYNGEVSNLFRILQRHYPQFMECLKFQITSRREFERLKASDPVTLTDLERAARFIYLQKTAFGGKVTGQNFGVSHGMPARFNINKLIPMLEAVHERLSSVIVESLDFGEFIQKYDRPETLFYLDPPYWNNEGDYGKGLFERGDFVRLRDILKGLKGRFILSLNDTPEVRACFAGFNIESIKLSYTLSKGKGTPANEVVISN